MLSESNKYEVTLKDGAKYQMQAVSEKALEKLNWQLTHDPEAICNSYLKSIPELMPLLEEFIQTGKLELTGELAMVMDKVAMDSSVLKGLLIFFGAQGVQLAQNSQKGHIEGIGRGRRISHSGDNKRLIKAVFKNEETKALTQKAFCQQRGISVDRYRRLKNYKKAYPVEDQQWIEKVLSQ